MKKIIKMILLAALLAAPRPASAQPEYSVYDGWFNHIAIGATVGMDGVGFEVATNFARRFEIRGGASWMPNIGPTVPFKITLDDTWIVNQKLWAKGVFTGSRANIMLDFYPGRRSGFRFTVGAFYEFDSNVIRGYTLEPIQIGKENWGKLPYRVNGQQFTTDLQGYVRAGLAGNKFRPFIAIGNGHCIAKNQKNQCGVDFGIIYLGRMIPYSFDYSSGRQETVVFTEETMQTLQDEVLKVHGAIDSMNIFTWLTTIRFMPVLRLTFTIRAY